MKYELYERLLAEMQAQENPMGFQIGAIAAMQEQDRKAELMLQWLKDRREIDCKALDSAMGLNRMDEESAECAAVWAA